MIRKTRDCRHVVPLVLIFVLSGFLVYLIFFSGAGKIQRATGSNQLTARLFWNSMRQNDEKILRSIVSSSQWKRIETWLDDHKPTNCHLFSDRFGPTSTGAWINEKKWIQSTSFNCFTEKDSDIYCFSIDNMVVEKTNNRWIVTDWGDIFDSTTEGGCY